MLQHVVLHKLSESPSSGYRLCSEIERETGKRPSYGSIYPILERMTKTGELTVRKDGRRKLYALTAKGKQTAKRSSAERAELVDDMRVRVKQLMALVEMDPQPMLIMLERAKKGEPPLGKVTAQMFRVRDLIFRMAADGKADRNAAEINKLLAQLTKRLEGMR
jgi:DNA-binding PadR family transcriptional regulator